MATSPSLPAATIRPPSMTTTAFGTTVSPVMETRLTFVKTIGRASSVAARSSRNSSRFMRSLLFRKGREEDDEGFAPAELRRADDDGLAEVDGERRVDEGPLRLGGDTAR